MKSSQNQKVRSGTADSGEETLRIIASLPAPEGLVDRVQTRLRTAPRAGRVLAWPMALAGGWSYGVVRGAAAAAIVCVVAGGGWRIYSRVQPGPSARVLVMPAPAGSARGFSLGGSVHTPDPARRPVLTNQMPGPAGETVPQVSAKKQRAGRKASTAPPKKLPR